jgi:hypothetical protein
MADDSIQRKTFYQPSSRIATASTVYEADLANLVAHRAVRQLVITRTTEGWMLQVLPTWKNQFMTLVSLRKEMRHYQDLDRLIGSIVKHGPLPPSLLLDDTS